MGPRGAAMMQAGLFTAPALPPRRAGGDQPLRVLFILCNPSTADGAVEDQTSRKGIGFSRRWAGWEEGAHDPIVQSEARLSPCGRYRYTLLRRPATRSWIMTFVNLFAWRATDPIDLAAAARRGEDVVGPENDRAICAEAAGADRIVVAWGGCVALGPSAPRGIRGRDLAVLDLLRGRDLWCLGVTAAGHPRHPRVLAYSTPLVRFDPSTAGLSLARGASTSATAAAGGVPSGGA